MRKCCHITSVHPKFDTRIFYKECKSLHKAGYDVVLIYSGDRNDIVDGIKIVGCTKAKSHICRIFRTLKLLLIAYRQNADLYHVHDVELLAVGLFLKLFARKKVIYDVHEDFPEAILSREWLPRLLRKPLSILTSVIEKLISQEFDCIITATPDLKNKFKKCRNVIDIRNYPLVDLIPISLFSTEKKHGNENNLIYVGGLERVRGTREIIQSLKFINPEYNVRLRLIGSFSERDFEKEMLNMPEWKQVKFLGRLSPERTYEYLAQSDIGLVCLYPLRRFLTSYPVKMFEYMAAGIPVVASDFPLWREIIEGNSCGMCIKSLKPEEIARAINYLLAHAEEARMIGLNGRKIIEKKYNWDHEVRKLTKVYEQLFQS
jgi:glycosyltransferase involved in cell wall biosynthesis